MDGRGANGSERYAGTRTPHVHRAVIPLAAVALVLVASASWYLVQHSGTRENMQEALAFYQGARAIRRRRTPGTPSATWRSRANASLTASVPLTVRSPRCKPRRGACPRSWNYDILRSCGRSSRTPAIRSYWRDLASGRSARSLPDPGSGSPTMSRLDRRPRGIEVTAIRIDVRIGYLPPSLSEHPPSWRSNAEQQPATSSSR